MPAFPAVAVCDVDAAADDPTATSGNCCLKLARRSSPGFCELVLEDGEKIHVSLWPIFQGSVCPPLLPKARAAGAARHAIHAHAMTTRAREAQTSCRTLQYLSDA